MSTLLAHESVGIVNQQLLAAGSQYRPTVVGGLYDRGRQEVLLVYPEKSRGDGERIELASQLPQGGMKKGETALDAFHRDVLIEELGLNAVSLSGITCFRVPSYPLVIDCVTGSPKYTAFSALWLVQPTSACSLIKRK